MANPYAGYANYYTSGYSYGGTPKPRSTQGWTASQYIAAGLYGNPNAPAPKTYYRPSPPPAPPKPKPPYVQPTPKSAPGVRDMSPAPLAVAPYLQPIAGSLPITTQQPEIKIATPDLIFPLRPESIDIDSMADLVFQDIGGHDILNVTRHDLVNGVNSDYQLVKNVSDINAQFNSKNLVQMQTSAENFKNDFGIDLASHINNGTLSFDRAVVKFSVTKTTTGSGDITKNKYIAITNIELVDEDIVYTTEKPHGLKPRITVEDPPLVTDGDFVSVEGVAVGGYNIVNAEVLSTPTIDKFVLDGITETQLFTHQDSSVYIDTETGDLVIQVKDLLLNEEIEIEIVTPENLFFN